MQYLDRKIDLSFTSKKSCFLFGPRQTGKSLLLKHIFPDLFYIDLLLSDNYLKYAKKPSVLREEVLAIKSKTLPIIIDEIQKIPMILDEVHYLIEQGYKFILTGSSARKLKRGAANLLGGRAREKHLFPFTSQEIINYDLDKIINYGSLPSIYFSDDPEEDLNSYVGTYLKEEVQAEGLVRGIGAFSRFLELAALTNAELINYSNIASDVGLSSKTIREYYQILEDTLIGSVLEPYTKTIKRKAISTSKFYFFDIGVSNILASRYQIKRKSELFGKSFEHFIFCELKAYLSYKNDRRKLTFWRSKNKQEVDFIIGNDIAIEVKGSEAVHSKHTAGLKALTEEINFKRKIIISLDDNKRLLDNNIEVYPYRQFLKELWDDEFVGT